MPVKPQASLLLVHGLGEHSSRYEKLVSSLVEMDIAVFTFDGRGHGKSSLKKPDAFFHSFRDYLKDIDALFGKVKDCIPGLPSFIYGHSMGGGLVAAYVLEYQPEAKGVILSSPAIKEAEGTSSLLIASARIIASLFPRMKVLKLDASKISRIQEEVDKYLNDPLVYTKAIPARTGYELLQITRFIQAKMSDFSDSVLIIHGTEDGLTNPKGSENLYEIAPSTDKTLHLIEGGYHELLNDLERDRVLDLILNWIRERV